MVTLLDILHLIIARLLITVRAAARCVQLAVGNSDLVPSYGIDGY